MFLVAEVVWDDWNEAHIARHGVTPDEVEDVVFSPPLWVERRGNGTYIVLGTTRGGRYLLVVLAPRGGSAYYVVTVRDMTPAERRRYTR
ncbi:MAG TPA: BrnT family toxin [Frankiaceae bacterium]|nr:BrnT family toxin [Frankiaceae bacterium]